MRKERILLFLGIWVAILPYLGFPYSWKNILFTISGLVLIYYSYTIHKENKLKNESKKTFNSFKENHNFNQDNTNNTVTEDIIELNEEKI